MNYVCYTWSVSWKPDDVQIHRIDDHGTDLFLMKQSAPGISQYNNLDGLGYVRHQRTPKLEKLIKNLNP